MIGCIRRSTWMTEPERAPIADPKMAIEMLGIVKRFPGVVANDGVDLRVRKGEIHALLGENGAGKSTLMNVLFGLTHQDEGTILVNDEPVHFNGPRDAVSAGLGMVHQHFMLIPVFTVTENIILGAEGPNTLLNRDAAERRGGEIAGGDGLHLDPKARLQGLPGGGERRGEILLTRFPGSR